MGGDSHSAMDFDSPSRIDVPIHIAIIDFYSQSTLIMHVGIMDD